MKNIFTKSLCLGLGAFILAVFARDLSLHQAIDLAMQNNNALTLQKHQQQLYILNEKQQFGQFLPTMSAGASLGRTYQLHDWSHNERKSASLSVNEKLDLSLWPSLSAAEANTREAKLRFKRFQESLSLTVAQTFLQCLGAQEKLNLAQVKLAHQRAVLAQIEFQQQSGAKTLSEVYQQESTVAQSVADSVQIANDLSDLLQNLVDLINSDSLEIEALKLLPIDISLNPEPPGEFNLQQSAEYLAQQEKIQGAQHSLQAARWNYFPTVSLGATLAHDFNMVRERRNTLAWTASLSVPILDGRTRHIRVARSKVNLQSAQIELNQQEQDLSSQQKSAVRRWQNAQNKLEALSRASAVAERSSQELEVRYQLGAATQLEMQQAQTLWQNAEIARIDANLSALNAYLNAMDAMGQLETALEQLTGASL
ncbi:MAG: TolC family protein [Fibrobacter sp.]|nr:TolC family protein [Fibrobacter sp.]